jgi:anhydro-N-acetylmuramic acid kinase
VGGEGAPLVPVYHAALARKIGRPGPIAFLNVGGVANFTFIGRDGKIIAQDTGPGNGMLDLTIQKRGLGRYDDGGSLAASGQVDEMILSRLLSHSYFARQGPKSLDRYDFPLDAVDALSDADAAATLVAFTAQSVALGARVLPERPELWIICGGGRHNPVIMGALRQALGTCEDADAFGLRGDFIEAEAIGFIAARSRRGLAVTYPDTTGAPSPTQAGTLYKARRPRSCLPASIGPDVPPTTALLA